MRKLLFHVMHVKFFLHINLGLNILKKAVALSDGLFCVHDFNNIFNDSKLKKTTFNLLVRNKNVKD